MGVNKKTTSQSKIDYATVRCKHPLLSRYIANYTYSIGSLNEQNAKLITRAFPSVMTQIYFEFYGGLSEIKGSDHGFAQTSKTVSTNEEETQSVRIEKRIYIKQGLGSWFDIYQLASNRPNRPIKNLKVDLYPLAFYELFQCSPRELTGEDVKLADLLGQSNTSLMLEQMEAKNTGHQLIEIVEHFFLQQFWQQISQKNLEIYSFYSSVKQKHHNIKPKRFSPPFPDNIQSLSQQAQTYHKSERWMQKRYAEAYGMSFKQIQGNLRFHSAHQELLQALCNSHPISLTELAYRSGYFDQAHFIKDFKRYTGMTPGNYLKSSFDQNSQTLWYW